MRNEQFEPVRNNCENLHSLNYSNELYSINEQVKNSKSNVVFIME
jgi:hypothetical protein